MKLTSAPGLAGLLSLGLGPATAETTDLVAAGEAVYLQVCFACHYATEMDPLVAAPPIFAVKHHYADFSDREGFVAAISGYVLAPSEAASRMPEARDRFGLMPAQEITEAEARAVAEYLYATDFALPDWYITLYQEEYGARAGAD